MDKKAVCIICNGINTINFRGELIRTLLNDHDVHVLLPFKDAPHDLAILKEWGVSCHDIYFQQLGMNPIVEFKTYLSIKNVLRLLQPDIILNYTIKAIVWGSLASRALNGVHVHS